MNEEPRVIRLHAADDVVIAINPIESGTWLEGVGIRTTNPIPAGHKVAVRAIAPGEPVKRYDQVIGFAAKPIGIGEHVHVHNLALHDFARDYAFCADRKPSVATEKEASFKGIVRASGRVATRNYVGIISTVNCSATVSKKIAEIVNHQVLPAYPNVDGAVAITHTTGCGMADEGEGITFLQRTLAGYARHVNFGGVLIIGLGCEVNQVGALLHDQGLERGPLLATMTIQDSGGTVKAVQRGVELIKAMLPEINQVVREPVSARHLTVALQCGGSDGYSGISANPALGAAVDLLVEAGGTAILSETPEIY
jgi:altronate hydrolase